MVAWLQQQQTYALRVEYESTDLNNFEYRAKALKKIKKYFGSIPRENNMSFGMYVYHVCKALGVKHFVTPYSEGYKTKFHSLQDIVHVVDEVNTLVISSKRNLTNV